MSRTCNHESVLDLCKADLPMLYEMQTLSDRFIKDRLSNARHKLEPFQIGFHAIPSLSPLHLHIISKDFDSPCLKHKEHWNSFTTDFFRPLQSIIREIEVEGKVEDRTEEWKVLKKQKPICSICGQHEANLPKTRAHYATHNIGA